MKIKRMVKGIKIKVKWTSFYECICIFVRYKNCIKSHKEQKIRKIGKEIIRFDLMLVYMYNNYGRYLTFKFSMIEFLYLGRI